MHPHTHTHSTSHALSAFSTRRHRRVLTIYRVLAFVLIVAVVSTGLRQFHAKGIGGSGRVSQKAHVRLALSATSSPRLLTPEVWASGGASPHRMDVAGQVSR